MSWGQHVPNIVLSPSPTQTLHGPPWFAFELKGTTMHASERLESYCPPGLAPMKHKFWVTRLNFQASAANANLEIYLLLLLGSLD